MKRSTVVRLICFIAVVFSLFIWTPEFFWFGQEGDDVGPTSVSLVELVKSFNKTGLGHSLKSGAVLALICGSLPLLAGLFGLVFPGSRALLVVSISTFAGVVASGAVFYAWISSIEPLHITEMGFSLGAYITGVALVLELGAGIISRCKEIPRPVNL